MNAQMADSSTGDDLEGDIEQIFLDDEDDSIIEEGVDEEL